MDYFCNEHQVTFFKKGKMKNYAHPIGETGQWCNMPEEPAAHPSTYEKVPLVTEVVNMGAEVVSVKTAKKPPPSDPKNRSFALSYAKDIAVAKLNQGEEMTTSKVIVLATRFAQYLDTGE